MTIKDFHIHLDTCSRCRNQCFNLCPTGATLLKEAATRPFEESADLCSPENPCCDRRGEYNGFASGPTIFTCPKNCSCHD